MITVSSALTGVLALGLGLVSHPLAFYALYVPGRTIFSGPLELGIPTAISNWFIRRRPLGLAVDSVAKGAGLVIIPLVAQFIITGWDWRVAWFALGVFTFIVGVVPSVLLMARRPEDMGLEPDPAPQRASRVGDTNAVSASDDGGAAAEISFTVREAVATRSFWILSIFSAAGFMVQAGVSLHQVPTTSIRDCPVPWRL